MDTSTRAPDKAKQQTGAPAGIVLRAGNLNQEVDAASADLVRRHATKLHNNGSTESAKIIIAAFSDGSLKETVPVHVIEKKPTKF
jgi:hypothetical protein